MKNIFQLIIFLLISIQTFSQWQWVHPQPCGNAVFSIDAVDSLHVWMVGTGGTILYTSDGGENWKLYNCDTNVILKSVSFIDTLNGWVSALGGFVLKTTDGGNTWTRSSIGTSYPGDICFTDSLNGWIGRQFSPEILQTLDGGNTWYTSTIGLTTDTYCVSFSDPLNGWVAGGGPLMSHTTDGGESWNLLYTSFPTYLRRLCTPNSLTVYAFTSSDSKIRYSWDGGITWGLRAPSSFVWKNMYFADKNNGWAVGVNSASPPIYSLGRIERTTNGGETFTNLYKLTRRSYLDNVSASDSLHAWVTGTGGMIFATNDGGLTWHEQSLTIADPYRVNDIFAIKEQHTAWAVGTGGFLIKTNDDGTTWEDLSIDSTITLTAVHFFDLYNGIVIGSNSQIFTTSNGGIDWEQVTSPVTGNFTDLFFQTSSHGWITANNRLLETLDGGETWTVKTQIPANVGFTSVVFTDSLHGWTVGLADNGSVYYSLMAYTIDGGTTWSTMDFSSPELKSIFFTDNLTGWMCGNYGAILRTVDGGLTWDQIIYDHYVDLNSVYFTDNENGWVVGENHVGASKGGIVLFTDDGGLTWQHKDNGVGRALLSVRFIDQEFGYATGMEGTVIRWGGTYVGTEHRESQRKDRQLKLFPNPTDNQLTIIYELKIPSTVEITIYSSTGRIVSTIVCEYQVTGYYSISFGSESLLPGIYYCTLKAGEIVQTKKFIKY